MRKSKIYCFSVIFIALFLLFTIIVFSEQSTSGFSNSFQQGFETGFKIGQKIKEKKLKEEQQKKLDDTKMKIDESINIFINLVKQYGEDNIYSETEKIQLNFIFLSFIPEIQMVLKNLNDSIQLMENEQDELNENKWSYENPDSNLKYNPFEDKWE